MAELPEDSITDESLMTRIQRGDREAFSVLVRRYTKMFYVAAYRMCSDRDAAEDIVQEAFLKLWNRPDIWDGARGVKFSTWFYRVVTNQAIDYVRKHKKTQDSDVLDRISDERADQQEEMEQNETQTLLENAIRHLPERQRTALNLCFYEGLSNKEAADTMGVGLKALESLLMRAKAGLKDELKGYGLIAGNLTGSKEKKYG